MPKLRNDPTTGLMDGVGDNEPAHEEGRSPNQVLTAIEQVLRRALDAFFGLAVSQADALCRFLLDIVDAFERYKLLRRRLVLLEVPIGNCLAVRTLEHLLRSRAYHERLRIALTLNERQKCGATRTEVLKEKLSNYRLKADDVVVYIDEWNSGVNFDAICCDLDTILPDSVCGHALRGFQENRHHPLHSQSPPGLRPPTLGIALMGGIEGKEWANV